MAEQVDVIICGGGSAGICAGVWLARCGINFRILEKRPGALKIGQADGVQCRTVEIFESFGLSETLLKESYHANEIVFWDPDGTGIKRTSRASDTRADLSHLPHVLLSQARVNEILTNDMERAARRPCIEYGIDVQGVEVDSDRASDPEAYCVTVKGLKNGVEKVYRAKYVLGSDGAHSAVRKSLGFKMVGDSTDVVWGVMDVYPRTDFPDIRKKTILNSKAGNLMIIPREGDCKVRFYIEQKDILAKDVTMEDLQKQARLTFSPYKLEIAETVWWSAYSIGQRLADYFHKDYRVFLSGDACHTHSPKAGQGMNVSLQDGYNIGWKLAAVLRGQASPKLLETYVSERQKIAHELIEFDRKWTKLFSTKYREEHGITSKMFQEHFELAGKNIVGQSIHYEDSVVVDATTSEAALASGLTIGMRLPSYQVVRMCDARSLQLVRALPAESQWHIIVFAGDIRNPEALKQLKDLSAGLEEVVGAFTPSDADRDAVINPILVLSSGRTEIEQDWISSVFMPVTGKWKIRSLLKVFVDDEDYNSTHGHAYENYGIDPSKGAIVIIRPDQYISKICSLESVKTIVDFFDKFMKRV
ncbi:FAD binding domain-containing protein [Jackrogersella minutella]|nr:FAD binding domain-containing protein [Jackrogersella minutella]